MSLILLIKYALRFIGAVYVFQDDGTGTFVFLQKLLPPFGLTGIQYGIALSISRDGLQLAVGIPNVGDTGSVDIFSRPTM